MFFIYLTIYIIVSLFITIAVFKKSVDVDKNERILLCSGVTALFYSPALVFAGFIPFPAPPIIGFIYFIVLLFSPEHHSLLVGTFLVSFIPYLIFWAIYYLIIMFIWRKKHNKSLNQIGAKDAPPG